MEQSSQSNKPWTDLSQYGQAAPRDHKEFPELTNTKQIKSQLRNAHVPKQSNLSNTSTITSTTHGSSPAELVTRMIAKDWAPTHDERFCKELRPQAQGDFLTSHGHLFLRGKKRLPCFTDKNGKIPQQETEITQKQRSLTRPAPLEEPSHGTDLKQIDPLAPARDDTCQQRSPSPPPPLEASSPWTNLNKNDQTPAQDDNEYPALTNTIPSKTKLRNAHVL